MGVKYASVKQDTDDATPVQWAGDAQVLRKYKFWLQLFALIAAFSVIWNLYLFSILAGIKEASDELYPEVIPYMPSKKLVFEENKLFSSPPSEESNGAWDDLLPPGRGFVYISDASTHGLQPGEQLESGGEAFSVAVFHQLHCLGMLRTNYWTLLDKIVDKDSEVEAWATMHRHNHHANHCFDYLRQSLQCAGDTALEWPLLESSGRRKSVDGWGVPHKCKDWEAIMDYMGENHVNGSKRKDISGE